MKGIPTHGPLELEIGKDRCFHGGNRVAITKSGTDDGEPYNVTVAEVWPTGDDSDIADGNLIVEAFNTHTETGLTPRQLAEQRGEMLAALKYAAELIPVARKYFPKRMTGNNHDRFQLENTCAAITTAIAKAGGGHHA